MAPVIRSLFIHICTVQSCTTAWVRALSQEPLRLIPDVCSHCLVRLRTQADTALVYCSTCERIEYAVTMQVQHPAGHVAPVLLARQCPTCAPGQTFTCFTPPDLVIDENSLTTKE